MFKGMARLHDRARMQPYPAYPGRQGTPPTPMNTRGRKGPTYQPPSLEYQLSSPPGAWSTLVHTVRPSWYTLDHERANSHH